MSPCSTPSRCSAARPSASHEVMYRDGFGRRDSVRESYASAPFTDRVGTIGDFAGLVYGRKVDMGDPGGTVHLGQELSPSFGR